jgi:pSer/pThr/pTyr-binding forkhead associated (FHA) protein
MVQFKVLSGKKAGTVWSARRFPVQIGRGQSADLQLEESGVWERHLRLDFVPLEGLVLTSQPEALTRVNGEPVQQTALRNGDTIELGATSLQFWLADSRQGGLRWREWLTWFAIAAVSLGQVGLVYLLW